MSQPAYNFKFIIVGNSAVGKSCLLLRFDEDRFQPIHDVTVGVTFSIKMLNIDGKDIKVQIWDTAGQEIFRSITRSYYRDSACAIIVYDITDRTSYEKVGDWIRDVRNLAPPDCQLVLVGNKLDLAAQRAVQTNEAADFADQHNLLFFEASAATGDNVQKLFNECVQAVFGRAGNSGAGVKPEQNIVINDKKKEQGACC
ncbi:GTP-binding protein YPTC4 [Tritrichomonas foetus]|uniref:GTP-binding protein YPTC4 n=1 Tax=Tritrichomonas foetus TaxID=1144522 RepID=A0A1J4KZX0_9EUKA|nr:GTP-binding protein YPTC4 [Tritrichomonas foetus]|eukprot:OHT15246.1 GTP-binding protein YPTC4 [Tritrichomonas foetus]